MERVTKSKRKLKEIREKEKKCYEILLWAKKKLNRLWRAFTLVGYKYENPPMYK